MHPGLWLLSCAALTVTAEVVPGIELRVGACDTEFKVCQGGANVAAFLLLSAGAHPKGRFDAKTII